MSFFRRRAPNEFVVGSKIRCSSTPGTRRNNFCPIEVGPVPESMVHPRAKNLTAATGLIANLLLFFPHSYKKRWFHTVENLEDTLSINHNWLNQANFHYCLDKLRTEVAALQDAWEENDINDKTEPQQQPLLPPGNNAQIRDDVDLVWQIMVKLRNQMSQGMFQPPSLHSIGVPHEEDDLWMMWSADRPKGSLSHMSLILDRVDTMLGTIMTRNAWNGGSTSK